MPDPPVGNSDLAIYTLNVLQTIALAYIANRSRRRRRYDDPPRQPSAGHVARRVPRQRRRRPPGDSVGP